MRYTIEDRDGFRIITAPGGIELGFSPESGIKIIEVDGLPFKDFLSTGTLLPYEDWHLPAEERAAERSYHGKTARTINRCDMELVQQVRQAIGSRPLIVVVNMLNPMVMSEIGED